MRIAFVTSEYVTEPNFDGGLANYIHRVSLALTQRGHQAIVIIPSTEGHSFSHDDIEVYRIANQMGRSIKLFSRLLGYRFHPLLKHLHRSWIINRAVRVLHRQNPLSIIQYSHIAGTGFFRPTHIPSVIRISSHTTLWRMYGGYEYLDARSIKQQELLEFAAIKRADGIYSPSELLAEVFQKELRREVCVIESPFVLDQLFETDYSALKFVSSKKYILFFGTLNKLKGLLVIAKMVHKLMASHPNLYFVFVGKSGEQYHGMPIIDYIRRMAQEYGERIIYLGKLPHSQLYPILEKAVAVVLPSIIDNFPNACLEAMAHRKVVIGTRGASFEQLLQDGFSGLLCEKDNPQSLLNAIDKALHLSDNQRKEIGQRAWERIQQLRPEIAAIKLEEFYNSIIARHNPILSQDYFSQSSRRAANDTIAALKKSNPKQIDYRFHHLNK
ncbi:MAG: D-inositol-3-phosphate glycosyltransferase [bacterium]|nr:D-inositol-3-phosphate glycosyltransferase [bacterium]